jgi:hypothetical protein
MDRQVPVHAGILIGYDRLPGEEKLKRQETVRPKLSRIIALIVKSAAMFVRLLRLKSE